MCQQIAVNDEVFTLLKSYASTETIDERGDQLTGESLDYYRFTGLYFVDVPPMDETVSADWDHAHAWLERLGGFNRVEILLDQLSDGFDIRASTIRELCVERKLLEPLSLGSDAAIEHVISKKVARC